MFASTASAQAIPPLVVEGDVLPQDTVTATYNADVTSASDWLVELDTDNALTTMNNAIVYNGTMVRQEGVTMISGLPVMEVRVSSDTMAVSDSGHFIIEGDGPRECLHGGTDWVARTVNRS